MFIYIYIHTYIYICVCIRVENIWAHKVLMVYIYIHICNDLFQKQSLPPFFLTLILSHACETIALLVFFLLANGISLPVLWRSVHKWTGRGAVAPNCRLPPLRNGLYKFKKKKRRGVGKIYSVLGRRKRNCNMYTDFYLTIILLVCINNFCRRKRFSCGRKIMFYRINVEKSLK